MTDQLSGVAIIICIAFGVLTFLLLFIFANRQIKRFSLKSGSGPYAPIAVDATKAMQLEIDRRLNVVKCISYHPKMLKKEEEKLFHETGSEALEVSPVHLYRMKVLDSLSTLEPCVISLDPTVGHLFTKDLRLCLVRLFQKGLLHQIEISVVHRFVDLCEFARHEPGEFGSENFVQFLEYFSQIKQSISPVHETPQPQLKNKRHFLSSSSTSVEQSKPLSNGKLSPAAGRTSPDGESGDEKKVTYETSV